MDYHAITSASIELVMRVVDGRLEIIPPAAPPTRQLDQFGKLDASPEAELEPAPPPPPEHH